MSIAQQDTDTPDARRALLAARLHAAADIIATYPSLKAHSITLDKGTVRISDYGADTAAALSAAALEIGGRWDKVEADELFKLTREVAEGVTVDLVAWRHDVCEPVVIGKETVELPDPDAPKVTVERDVIEWKCRPLLVATEPSA